MIELYQNLANPTGADALRKIKLNWHIQDIFVFGSVLGGDFRKDSDLDLLLDFIPGQEPSYLQLVYLQQELETLFERKVDVVTRAGLLNSQNSERAKTILNTCQPIGMQT